MKLILLSFHAMILIAVTAHAQLKAGDHLTGLSTTIGYSVSNNENSFSSNINSSFSLGIGGDYFHLKTSRHGVGVRLRTAINTNRQKSENPAVTSSFNGYLAGIDVFARNYFPLVTRFYFHLEYGLGINMGRNKSKPGEITTRNMGLNGYFTPGISYMTRKKIILEANLNSLAALVYNRSKSSENNYTISQDIFSLSSTLFTNNLLSNFSFSMKWNLRK